VSIMSSIVLKKVADLVSNFPLGWIFTRICYSNDSFLVQVGCLNYLKLLEIIMITPGYPKL
jgi:hypothetical protein